MICPVCGRGSVVSVRRSPGAGTEGSLIERGPQAGNYLRKRSLYCPGQVEHEDGSVCEVADVRPLFTEMLEK